MYVQTSDGRAEKRGGVVRARNVIITEKKKKIRRFDIDTYVFYYRFFFVPGAPERNLTKTDRLRLGKCFFRQVKESCIFRAVVVGNTRTSVARNEIFLFLFSTVRPDP